MKKFLALLLAAMMLLSCTTAMAASDTINNTTHDNWSTTYSKDLDADIRAYDSVNYADTADYDTHGELGTELWMQVTADGQIDVTVPLVLVFQTNLDGGTATTSDRYQILNNNNAEVVVTKIEFEKSAFGNATTTEQMDMVDYDTANLGENQYKALLEVDSARLVNKTSVNGQITAEVKAMSHKDSDNVEVLYTAENAPDNEGKYDMNSVYYAKDAKHGGLFKLLRNTENQDAKTNNNTPIKVTMETGRLNFVTYTDDTGANEKMNIDKGVHLLTTTYTVAIDTHKQYGWDILGADGKTTHDEGRKYLNEAGTTSQTAIADTADGSTTVSHQAPVAPATATVIDSTTILNK